MSSPPPKSLKRSHAARAAISPPPAKRKLLSGTTRRSSYLSEYRACIQTEKTTTENAVASFFTPASKKPPPQMIWQERGADQHSPNTLIVGKYVPESIKTRGNPTVRRKIVAFDLVRSLTLHTAEYELMGFRIQRSSRHHQGESLRLMLKIGNGGMQVFL